MWTNIFFRRKSRSSVYRRRLMSWKSWVRIPALFTGRTFFQTKINKKEAGDGPLKKTFSNLSEIVWAKVDKTLRSCQTRNKNLTLTGSSWNCVTHLSAFKYKESNKTRFIGTGKRSNHVKIAKLTWNVFKIFKISRYFTIWASRRVYKKL